MRMADLIQTETGRLTILDARIRRHTAHPPSACPRADRTARVSIVPPRGGRAWLSVIKEKVQSATAMRANVASDQRWVTVAFTWHGLRVLGLDEPSLASFPEKFKQGMAARAVTLGDTGANAPEHWVGGPGSPDLHAIAILFARNSAEHDQCVAHRRVPRRRSPLMLDLKAVPPLDYAHDHFGYRDRLSQPLIDGSGEEPTPGSGLPLKAGEFILGYPDEHGMISDHPRPEILARNGSYMAYRRLEEHVGSFRAFLRQHGETPEEQELIAAKPMGRWRRAHRWWFPPTRTTQRSAPICRETTISTIKKWILTATPPPLGSHARRMNPRDRAHNINRRRMIRRGATYGPHLAEDAPDDGVERGIAAFVICASLIRQFEFAQNAWANDRSFHELGNERDPIIGNQDGSLEFKIPRRPIRKKITGLPAFTTVRGGAYFFLPGRIPRGTIVTVERKRPRSLGCPR